MRSSVILNFTLAARRPLVQGPGSLDVSTVRSPPAAGCAGNCSGNGACTVTTGQCSCNTNYFGEACEHYCPNSCSGRGDCMHGACLCLAGYQGASCEEESCCSGHGSCTDGPGDCRCDLGWTGSECNLELLCPDPVCSSHGACSHGMCMCSPGFSGPACSNPVPRCDGMCGAQGTCNHMTSTCDCAAGWTGQLCDLQERTCPNSCSSHGTCYETTCSCWAGFTGEDCGLIDGSAPRVYASPCSPTTNVTLSLLGLGVNAKGHPCMKEGSGGNPAVLAATNVVVMSPLTATWMQAASVSASGSAVVASPPQQVAAAEAESSLTSLLELDAAGDAHQVSKGQPATPLLQALRAAAQEAQQRTM